MIFIFLSTLSKKSEVIAFLEELNAVLQSDDFNMDTDLIIIRKKKRDGEQFFSTPYTLVDLGYDAGDIAERLKQLTVEEYSETKIDKDDLLDMYVKGNTIVIKKVKTDLKDIRRTEIFKYDEKMVERLRCKYKPNDRIMCIEMDEVHSPIKYGDIGTIRIVDDMGFIHVDWEKGIRVALNPKTDTFKLID